MSGKLTRELIIETREIWLPLVPVSAPRPACPECGGALQAPAEAAALHCVSRRQLFRGLEQGLMHFCETAAGEMFFRAAALPPDARQLDE